MAGAALGVTEGLTADFLGAALRFAAGFFLAACAGFFAAVFFIPPDFLRAGLDFLAASVCFFFGGAFFFAAFFTAGFFFALAIGCLLYD